MIKKKKIKPDYFTRIIISSVLILVVVQLMMTYRLATLGRKVSQYEKIATQLEAENLLMANEINQVGSLSKISLKAEELGFVRSSRVVHLLPQLPVAWK